MRFFLPALGLVLFTALRCAAQVSVELSVDQDQYLRDESLPVKVLITNRSGQTLHLGKEKNWLTFSVENRDGSVVVRTSEVPVEGEFSLESALQATRRVDLMPYYDLSQPGRYRVSAVVRIKEWNEEITSQRKEVYIVKGVKIWEQDFGVPAPAGPPEVRKYALQQAIFLKQLRLYVRITDLSENTVFRVLSVGSMVSFNRPEHEVDWESNLHLLFQTGARSFQYCVVTPKGELSLRQTHDYAPTRPVLRGDEKGRIRVVGGDRRATPSDFPAPAELISTNDVKAAQP